MVTLNARSEPKIVSTYIPQGASRPDDMSDNAHRQLIGYIGLLLPLLLIVIAISRDGLERWKNLESISAYYYTGAVAGFVGMLVALALFLFTYRGYKNKYNLADRIAAKTAAVASVVVAFFPTKAPEGVAALSWWTATTGILHHVAAVVLFIMFAIFALWLFRLTADGEQPVPDKRRRNTVYLVCGIVIVVCIGWAGLNARADRPIFWPESIALVAFALSWLVKGYALNTVVDKARSMRRS